jgi:hypothetical protein
MELDFHCGSKSKSDQALFVVGLKGGERKKEVLLIWWECSFLDEYDAGEMSYSYCE